MPNGNGNNGTRKVRRSQAEKAEMYAEKIKVYADKLKDLLVAAEGGVAASPGSAGLAGLAAKLKTPAAAAAGLGAAAAAAKKAPITCPGGPVLYNRFITSIKNLLKEKYQSVNPASSVKEFDSKYPHAKVKEIAGAAWKASKGAICGEEGDAALTAMAQAEADRIYSMTSGRGFTNEGRGTVANIAAAAARANTPPRAAVALGPPAGAGAQTKKAKKTVTILGANSPVAGALTLAPAKTAKVKKSKAPLFNNNAVGTTEANAAAAVARTKEALRKLAEKKAAKKAAAAPTYSEANALAALAELEAEGVPTPVLTLAAPVNNSRKSRKAEKKRKAAAEKAATAFEAAAVAAGLPPTGNTPAAGNLNLGRRTPTPEAAGNLNLGRRTPTPAAAAGNLNVGRRTPTPAPAGNNGSPGLNLGAPTPVSSAELVTSRAGNSLSGGELSEAGGASSYSLPAGVTNLGAALNATGENTGLRKIRVGTNEFGMNNQRGLWSGEEGLEWVGLLRPNGSVEYTNSPPENE